MFNAKNKKRISVAMWASMLGVSIGCMIKSIFVGTEILDTVLALFMIAVSAFFFVATKKIDIGFFESVKRHNTDKKKCEKRNNENIENAFKKYNVPWYLKWSGIRL